MINIIKKAQGRVCISALIVFVVRNFGLRFMYSCLVFWFTVWFSVQFGRR